MNGKGKNNVLMSYLNHVLLFREACTTFISFVKMSKIDFKMQVQQREDGATMLGAGLNSLKQISDHSCCYNLSVRPISSPSDIPLTPQIFNILSWSKLSQAKLCANLAY